MQTLKSDSSHPVAVITALIVDDEPAMRTLVRRCLEGSRFDIVDAANGREAIDAAGRLPALDLLITDEMMPEMEGHELSRHLRAQNPDLRVLYLTGHADHLFEEKQ